MNRRQKIIVSVTGIFIVLLILVGLTYAYFLTKITGNTNDKSISVTTANLALVYSDGTDIVLTSEDKLIPGEFTKSKTFTVENTGNATVENYAVVIEDVVNPLDRPEDMEMTLTCTSNIEGNTCNGKVGSLPNQNDILVINSIDEGEIQTYEITLSYVDPGVDQSSDMGKTIEGKLNIIDTHNTIDLTGTVASVSEGDYVQVNSEPRVSQINSDKTYKVVGLEPGTHTIGVYGSDGTLKGSKTFTLNKADEESVSGTTINFTETSRTATINIGSDYSISISDTIEKTASFEEGTLAYAILKDNKVTEPSIQPGVFDKYAKAEDPTSFTSSLNPTKYYIAYASDYTIDESTGKFTLGTDDAPVTIINKGKFTYTEELANELAGKYMYSSYSSAITEATVSSLNYLEKITTTVSDITSSEIYYADLSKGSKSIGSSLSISADDYGDSYYFRGDIKNNFVNFSGMCWRIVRIQGDGSVKITLADENRECDSLGYTTKRKNTALVARVYGFSDYQNGEYFFTESLNAWMNGGTYENQFKGSTILESHISNENQEKLLDNDWCFDTSVLSTGVYEWWYEEYESFSYNSYKRLSSDKTPTLKCDMTGENNSTTTKINSKIGLLTADEVMFAGAVEGTDVVQKYYLTDNISGYYWTMTIWRHDPAGYTSVDRYYRVENGVLYEYGEMSGGYIRPTVVLKSDVKVSGDGTQSNPYVVE